MFLRNVSQQSKP